MDTLSIYSSLEEINYVLRDEVRNILNGRSIKDISTKELKIISEIYTKINRILADKLELKEMELERKTNKK